MRKWLPKWGVVAGLVVLFCLIYLSPLHDYLNFERLQKDLALFQKQFEEQPILLAFQYSLLYILVTISGVPGAGVLTVVAGSIFGVFWGTVIVSFASTIGATGNFWTARFLLHDWLEKRFGRRLRRVKRGVRKEGAFYLFSLRLIPVFPFFIINLMMGLTPMRMGMFYTVSQLGMLPGTIVYVNTGALLATVSSPQDLISLPLVLTFLLLAAMPWVGRSVIRRLRKRFRS